MRNKTQDSQQRKDEDEIGQISQAEIANLICIFKENVSIRNHHDRHTHDIGDTAVDMQETRNFTNRIDVCPNVGYCHDILYDLTDMKIQN